MSSPLQSCRVTVKAIPNAPRTQVAGWLGDMLKLKVHAPPLDGRANDELCEFLAETLKLPRRSVSVMLGDKSRQKVVQIEGLNLAQVRARLGVSV